MTPKRIQRTRAKGWRMPEGAVYVGRPSNSEAVLAEVLTRREQQGGIVPEHAEAGVALVAERSAVLHSRLRMVMVPAEALGRAADLAPVTHLGLLRGPVGDLVRPRPRVGLGPAPEPPATVARRDRRRSAHRAYRRPARRIDLGKPMSELLRRRPADHLPGSELPVVARHTEPAGTHWFPAPRFGTGCRLFRRDHRHG